MGAAARKSAGEGAAERGGEGPWPRLPVTAEEEARDPQAADRANEAGCAWLLAQTRDRKRFALLFEENVNYGFRRNFWAIKPLALTASIVTLAASTAAIAWSLGSLLEPTLRQRVLSR